MENLNSMLVGVLAVFVALLFVWMIVRWLLTRERGSQESTPNLAIDVNEVTGHGPPSDGPCIEFYGTPVRVAVVVVAPVGRDGELPPAELLPGILERLVPGLADVIAYHHPVICRWPEQLSAQGFAQSFFNNVRLPGDRGKGTPWCSIAGRLQIGDRQFLVGMALEAAMANGLGQIVARHEGTWLDILRIHE